MEGEVEGEIGGTIEGGQNHSLQRRREASPAAFTVPPSLMANRPPSLMTTTGGGGGGATEKLPEGYTCCTLLHFSVELNCAEQIDLFCSSLYKIVYAF